MRVALLSLLTLLVGTATLACSGDGNHSSGDTDSDTDSDTDTDADSDTDTDSDTDADEWCPELPTSCSEPEALSSCGDDSLAPPRLIRPLSGRHIRDRRPQIIWETAAGVTEYRLEIARDREFTEVVYRSSENEANPGHSDRLQHTVECDLDCGVHFFRVVSVTSPECETGSASYTWEMFVGMAPGDVDRDGTPDIMDWRIVEPVNEMEPTRLQGWGFLNLNEYIGGTAEAELMVDIELENEGYEDVSYHDAQFLGDVNGDNYQEIGIVLDFFGVADDYSTLTSKLLVVSPHPTVQSSSDDGVLFSIESDLRNTLWLSRDFEFSDANGDGFSDIVITVNDYSDTSSRPDARVFFGCPEISGEIHIDEADIVLECGASCDEDSNFSPGVALDANGDGFADFSVQVFDTDYGHPDAGEYHITMAFGGPSLTSTSFEESGVVISSTVADQSLPGWNIGTGPVALYGIGDFDDDGFKELAGNVLASYETETTATGGWAIYSDFTDAGKWLFNDLVETFFLGDFFVASDEWATEHVSYLTAAGDLDGDEVDDIILGSRSDESEYGYSARDFYIYGSSNWGESVLLSSIPEVKEEKSEGDYRAAYSALPDIDADGVSEVIIFESLGVLLARVSFSGQYINIYFEGGTLYPEFQ